MKPDVNLEDLRRAAHRRRLLHLVLGCTALSTLLTVGVTREVSIHEEVDRIRSAPGRDLDALEVRQTELKRVVRDHHFWTGAFGVRSELSELEVVIAELRRAAEARAADEARDSRRRREDAELERLRGLVAAERGRYADALEHFRAALRAAELVGPSGFDGAAWEHRGQVIADIEALEHWGDQRR